MTSRCTDRKHVQERGNLTCDCGTIMVALTADKNARVVTLLDHVQRKALATLDRTPR